MASVPKGSGPVSREWPGASVDSSGTTGDEPWASTHLLRALNTAQSEVLLGGDLPAVLERLLAVVLELTGSPSGLIGEVGPSSEGALSLQVLASTPRSWAQALRESPVSPDAGGPELKDLRTFVSAVLTTGRPVQFGDASTASQGSAPAPSLHTFLGLPLELGGEQVGLVGLANRPGGYDARLVDFLQPLLTTCGALLLGQHTARRQRQAQEERLRAQIEHTERLSLALDNVENGLWDWDFTTRTLYMSPRWLSMLGYAEGELPSTLDVWKQLCHPDDLPEQYRRFQEYLEGKTHLFEVEYRALRKDGTWRWMLGRAKIATRDAQGRPLRMVGTNMDIDARKRGEERLRALVRAIPDLIFRNSSDGTYLDFELNNGQPAIAPADSLIGRNLRQMPMPPSIVDKLLLHLGRAIQQDTLEVFEYALELPQLGRQHYEARIHRSGPDEAVTIVRNITSLKQTEERLLHQEEELRRHRDSLEELVRNRSEKLRLATLELEDQQAQLIQAEKLASLGQMAAGVAHEINNPVSYVMSNLGTLDEYVSVLAPLLQLQRELMDEPGPATEEARQQLLERMREQWKQGDVDFILGDLPEMIQESQAGTRRIQEITQSLRAFAREDSGAPQMVDVNAELSSTLKMVWNELKYKCEVKRDFGALPPISFHPTQLAQVFTNLLVNAAQAMETRGEIRIRTRHEGNDVVVEIADTGKGMTQETLSKLFTPFFTTKPRGQGTGLGLSVSYGIITRHKGRIDVQSEPGKGSTFIVRLPIAAR
ncbi:ATP-binding protein [Archangium sp.]|uniref:ATP-binding protein n=1 Tax=Archangium sp. TaxID=1872627 RepID=UPI00286B73D3|nr:ATP-binding protein [Archangium sp.]